MYVVDSNLLLEHVNDMIRRGDPTSYKTFTQDYTKRILAEEDNLDPNDYLIGLLNLIQLLDDRRKQILTKMSIDKNRYRLLTSLIIRTTSTWMRAMSHKARYLYDNTPQELLYYKYLDQYYSESNSLYGLWRYIGYIYRNMSNVDDDTVLYKTFCRAIRARTDIFLSQFYNYLSFLNKIDEQANIYFRLPGYIKKRIQQWLTWFIQYQDEQPDGRYTLSDFTLVVNCPLFGEQTLIFQRVQLHYVFNKVESKPEDKIVPVFLGDYQMVDKSAMYSLPRTCKPVMVTQRRKRRKIIIPSHSN